MKPENSESKQRSDLHVQKEYRDAYSTCVKWSSVMHTACREGICHLKAHCLRKALFNFVQCLL